MAAYLADISLALWLGILTSVSPCPLAANVAAVSYLARQVKRAGAILTTGLSYTLGRTAVYVVLGAAFVTSSEAVPVVSMFLQRYMNVLLGPVLVAVGILLLGILKISFGTALLSHGAQRRLASAGNPGAFLLGAVFALTFCPVSAALFFGSTIAVALRHGSRVAMPAAYGVGTAAPVVAFAFMVAFGAHLLGKTFSVLAVVEKWARRVSGVVFAGVGLYMTARHTLGLF